jgi:hypothetical protein
VAWCRYQLMLVMALPSLAVESCWRWRWCCWVLLVMALPRQHWPSRDVIAESCWRWCYRVLLPMALPSLTGNGITEATLSVHDVAIGSCWWWRCRGDVGRGVISLSSHAGDGVAKVTLAMAWCRYRVLLAMALPRWRWSWCHVATKSCWWWHCRVDVGCGVMLLPSHASDGILSSSGHAGDGVAKATLVMVLPTTMLMWHLVWFAYKYWVNRK